MSGTAVVSIGATDVRVQQGTSVRVQAWDGAAPEATVRALMASGERPRGLVLLVDAVWLEIATPQLPPVAPVLQRRMLTLDADRFFPLTEPAALVLEGDVAFAMPAATLTRWRDAFATWAPVQAVLAWPQVARMAGADGTWRTGHDATAAVDVQLRGGRVVEVRRAPAHTPEGGASRTQTIDLATAAARVLAALPIAPAAQLLEADSVRALESRDRQAWMRAAAVCLLALLALGASASRWRDRELRALAAQLQALETRTVAARTAQTRLARADDELRLLAEADRQATRADAPLAVIARLGTLVPADAWVQHLEWDGRAWRIDGSAADAAALVPRLDGEGLLADVRSLAPSTRFLDNGRPRGSFSIGFTTRTARPDSTRGTHGAP
jgi:hypothetical protein